MKIFNSKLFKLFVLICLFLLFLFLTAKSYANSISNDLKDNIFRLHIIANSDLEEDQNLKLKVRDSITQYMKTLTLNCKTKNEVIDVVNNHINDFYNIVQKTIQDNGYNYSINIEVGKFYFPTKYYGNISLPSGLYDALKIEIGEAKRTKLVVQFISTTMLYRYFKWSCRRRFKRSFTRQFK